MPAHDVDAVFVDAVLVDAVFAALGDPTRRRLMDQISRQGPLTVTELSGGYPMSRQAVAKHMGALTSAGLITGERVGREVRYRVVADRLDGAVAWLADVGRRWDRRLAALHLQMSDPRKDE